MTYRSPDAPRPPERDPLGRWLAGLGAVVAGAALVGLVWIVAATIAAPAPKSPPVAEAAAPVDQQPPAAMVQALVAIATNTAPTPTPSPVPTETPEPTETPIAETFCISGLAQPGDLCRWPKPLAPTPTPYPACATPIADQVCVVRDVSVLVAPAGGGH
jgi:hypothetical protein